MNFFEFDNVSYTYPLIDDQIETDENGQPILPKPVFDYFTAQLPACFMSLIGPNASGKSTFMLLAAGKVKPNQGSVKLLDKDFAALTPQQADALCSFVYQNMEFENDDKVASLLEYVFANGYHSKTSPFADLKKAPVDAGFYNDVIKVFELSKVLDKKLTGISKGEIQRVLLAFSVLYGAHSIFMDEPMFAMEENQKHSALEFLRDYSKKQNVPVCMAMHELDLSRKYAENVLLFYPDRRMDFGTPEEVLTTDALQDSYGVPAAMLRDSEALNRQSLKEASETLQSIINTEK